MTPRPGRDMKMSFEDRIRSTVDQAVAPLVQQLLTEAAADRGSHPRREGPDFEEAEQAARPASPTPKPASAPDGERSPRRARRSRQAEREIRQQLEAEVDKKMHDALEAAENRMRIALADGEARPPRSRRPRSRRRASRNARSKWPASAACSKAFAASMAPRR